MDNKDFVFDVEESQSFLSKNLDVLVFKNSKTGKRLFVRPTNRNGEFIELVPLSLDELKTLKIEESISETVNSELFDVDIEESESESAVEPIGKVTRFNTQNPEDMKRAKELAEKILQKHENQEQESTETAKDTDKEVVDDIREKLSLELAVKEIEIEPSEIKGKKDIERWVGVIKKLEKPKDDQFSAKGGYAPMPSQVQQNQQGWGSHEEMVKDLRTRANNGDANAKEALRQLTFKVLKGNRQIQTEPYQRPQEQTTTSDLSPDLKLAVKSDVCGIQSSFRKKKLMERAQRGDKYALELLNSGNF